MTGVGTQIDGRVILQDVNWTIDPGQNWIVLGPNGGGKSTLIAIAGLRRHPTWGRIKVLGAELGKVDIRPLRSHISTSSANFAMSLRPALSLVDVVRCGSSGALEPWWHDAQVGEQDRAKELLSSVGLAGFADQTFGTLSSGERQRCLLARALMPDPRLLLLDEPNAGLDLAGREQLITTLDSLAAQSVQAAQPAHRATVLVTHHVEDIPASATHLLALAGGQVVTAGVVEETLTAELLSELFALPVQLNRVEGRWTARV